MLRGWGTATQLFFMYRAVLLNWVYFCLPKWHVSGNMWRGSPLSQVGKSYSNLTKDATNHSPVSPNSPTAPRTKNYPAQKNSISAIEKPKWKKLFAATAIYITMEDLSFISFSYSLWMLVFAFFSPLCASPVFSWGMMMMAVCLWETSTHLSLLGVILGSSLLQSVWAAKYKELTILFLLKLKSPLIFLPSQTTNPFSQSHGPGTWPWSLRGLNTDLLPGWL